MDNLVVLCRKCHSILHAGRKGFNHSKRPHTSKYIREYGMTLEQMSIRFGGNPNIYRKMHEEEKLHEYLEEAIKERNGEIINPKGEART